MTMKRSWAPEGLACLTPAERTVVALVAKGFTNDQIVRELWITRSTVKTHLSAIFRKLDVPNRASQPV